mmetsp:Transcript_3245/g.11762  ORF Transcript_3245/g.11762 Transcript_3245/m.11762 type:complete len:261 (-) Transcript_3245:207-989(-)
MAAAQMSVSQLASRTAIASRPAVSAKPAVAVRPSKLAVVCEAESKVELTSRRAALSIAAAGAALVAQSNKPALAAYGQTANVFGSTTNTSGFYPFAGDGFALLIPSKWGPSKQQEFPGSQARFEDNFDAVNNLAVCVLPTDKKSVKDYGSPKEFLSKFQYLLGSQSYEGNTKSEGGFAENRVSVANILDLDATSKNGLDYYLISILTRTADGDEGGRHQFIKAAVSDGNIYILKIQAGDKRYFKGADKEVEAAVDSFTVV